MKKLLFAAAATLLTSSAFAGGHLTNTNQSISFLRNPARNAAIGIDGVYSNPAGVAFLNEGFHLNLGIQSAFQTRTINSTNDKLFPFNVNNPSTTKEFKGKATAPVIPSIQAAYNTKSNWSFQFNFAVHGGGGKCEFADGIGTFDEALGKITGGLKESNNTVTGYSANSYMQGNQYYFGFTLGAAYKFNKHLSAYVGVRALYGTASYKATISNINVHTTQAAVPFDKYLAAINPTVTAGIAQCEAGITQLKTGIAQLEAGGQDASAYRAQLTETEATLAKLKTVEGLNKYSEGVNLQSDQTGFGIAPILGIDYKIGQFNFAAKYEFRTKMSMKNKSTLTEAGIMEPLQKFEDGRSIREDNPAMLSVGAQWSALKNLRINAGYQHFFDKQSKKFGDTQKLLNGGTNEYLGGIEWDIINKVTVSGGFQITRYGLSDAFMNDMSYVVNSWSFGLGAKWQINKTVAVEAAYFQTNYGKYKAGANANGTVNEYTRTNRVFGIGTTLNF